MIGYSGPCYDDQEETTWKEIGVEPEYTTVTNLERRVFTFSWRQYKQAIWRCEPDYLFVNFCNYLKPDKRRFFIENLRKVLKTIRPFAHIKYLGFGPTENNIDPLHAPRNDGGMSLECKDKTLMEVT